MMNRPTLTIDRDTVFTTTPTGSAQALIFDEWTTSDGLRSGGNPIPDQGFAFVRNATAGSMYLFALQDNLAQTIGIVTDNDGYLFFDIVPVVDGDTFTVKAGSYTFNSNGGFTPCWTGRTLPGTFS